MKKILNDLISKKEFNFLLSMDCEGYNFDNNLKNNVLCLEKLLKLNTENNIYTLLFITPYFAEMLNKLNLTEKIKNNYKVIFGLHIHPNNLPQEINRLCPFIRSDEDCITAYSYEQQKLIIKHSLDFLNRMGIDCIEAFRGGYFSIDDNTEKVLNEISSIQFESHNIYRKQYKVKNKILKSLPVYAFNDEEELRLEYFNIEKLKDMLLQGIKEEKLVIGITHSYLLDINDYHYKRDNIKPDIHQRMEELIKIINK